MPSARRRNRSSEVATRRAVIAGASATVIAGAAPRAARAATEADVLVIGAGLAGLAAAHLLEAGGAKVVVVESEHRVGGRLHTLDDLPSHPEAGGIQVGQGYARFEAAAARCGIALVPGGAEPRGTLYRIHGTSVAAKDWATSRANRLPPADRAIMPAALASRYWAQLPVLARPGDWLTTDFGRLDIAYAKALEQAGASLEARQLIGANLNGNSLASLSQLHIARSLAIFRAGAGSTRVVAGGSQRLPEAMAARLRDVRLGQHVRAIRADANGVTVELDKGRLRARQAICTIPFSALRAIPVEGVADPALRRAIPTLGYTHATFTYIAATTPFWREDGLGETLWTDEPLLGRVFVLSDDPPMLKTFVTGPGALATDRMSEAESARRIVAGIEAARPAARGKLHVLRRFSWQQQPGARAIYHHIGAGQAAMLAAAVQAQGVRVHFAGEHLAHGASGMEGAVESGEHTARLVVGRL